MEERVKVLKSVGQSRCNPLFIISIMRIVNEYSELINILTRQESLAYVTACTHGLTNEVDELLQSFDLEKEKLPEVDPDAALLKSPVPITRQETNWPLLTVPKGILFDPNLTKESYTAYSKHLSMSIDVIVIIIIIIIVVVVVSGVVSLLQGRPCNHLA